LAATPPLFVIPGGAKRRPGIHAGIKELQRC
jgi:hypothetical protein